MEVTGWRRVGPLERVSASEEPLRPLPELELLLLLLLLGNVTKPRRSITPTATAKRRAAVGPLGRAAKIGKAQMERREPARPLGTIEEGLRGAAARCSGEIGSERFRFVRRLAAAERKGLGRRGGKWCTTSSRSCEDDAPPAAFASGEVGAMQE